MARNATLSYNYNNTVRQIDLYVNTLAQPHRLTGASAQSRLAKQFYPRAYAPGNMTVEGVCRNEREYQQLALFIRQHHRVLINTANPIMFTRAGTTGYNRLLRLNVPSEGILYRGYIENFSVSKRGVFNVAPPFEFEFVVIFDPHAKAITPSTLVRQFYQDLGYKITPPFETPIDGWIGRGELPATLPDLRNVISSPWDAPDPRRPSNYEGGSYD
jgi:hypothetical protein